MLHSLMSKVVRRSDNRLSITGASKKWSIAELPRVEIIPRDLRIKATLGDGAYGKVYLVQHKTMRSQSGHKMTYALKKMSKQHLVKKRQVDHVKNERRLLECGRRRSQHRGS